MSFSLITLALLAGWCGNEPIVLPPIVVQPKPPRPICTVCILTAAFGGLGLAALVTQGFTVEASILPVAISGYIGGRVVSDLYRGFFKAAA